jgi:hypothetical protein
MAARNHRQCFGLGRARPPAVMAAIGLAAAAPRKITLRTDETTVPVVF